MNAVCLQDKENSASNSEQQNHPELDGLTRQVRLLILQLQTARRPFSRAAAALQLGLLWDRRHPQWVNDWIAGALQRALNPSDIYGTAVWEVWTVRINAAWASGYFGRVTPGTLTGDDHDRNLSLAASAPWERWVPLPMPTLSTALRALKSRQWFVRLFAAYCLQWATYRPAEAKRAVIALSTATRDTNKDARMWAIRAIKRIRTLATIEPLWNGWGILIGGYAAPPNRHW